MIERVTAIYDAGVFRPLNPVNLPDQEVVTLVVETCATASPAVDRGSQTLFELLNDAGLVGVVKDAPVDLSSNPKYLEGFGKSGD